jgi:hypothetical protein
MAGPHAGPISNFLEVEQIAFPTVTQDRPNSVSETPLIGHSMLKSAACHALFALLSGRIWLYP